MNQEELKKLEDSLWAAATNLRSGSGLKSNEYSTPILGIVFLRFAEAIYKQHEGAIRAKFAELQADPWHDPKKETIASVAIGICGFYLPDHARYDYLLNGVYKQTNKETRDALKDAMRSIEAENSMPDTLPINEYDALTSPIIETLIKKFSEIPVNEDMDLFGKIYEFFLGEFALAEGQKGGEFFTPTPVVKLMVEILDPKGGKLLDPACGSGGMFVQSAQYIKRHYPDRLSDFVVYGIEKTPLTSRLARMNTKINGVRSIIKAENTFESEMPFVEQFDYVMANPPFNVKEVQAKSVAHKTHFNAYGLPKNKGKNKEDELIPNANYLWISLFAAALKPHGRAGLVMSNAASDARDSELEIRKRLIELGLVEAMLTLSSNLFNTVTLPATLWFFTKPETTPNKEALTVLFVDARNIFTQLTRKQRTFTPEQIQNIALIFRLYRGEHQAYADLVQTYEKQLAQAQAQADEKEAPLRELDAKLTTLTAQLALLEEGKEKTKQEKEQAKWLKEREELHAKWQTCVKRVAYFREQQDWLRHCFPDGVYRDVTGLCKRASYADLQEQDFSLNPGRYVGVVIEKDGLTAEEFEQNMEEQYHSLLELNQQSRLLEKQIHENFIKYIKTEA